MNPLTLNKQRQGVFGHHKNGNTTITFKRRLNHPVEKVWRAITEPGETNAWFPMLKKLELKPGGNVIMDFSGGENCEPNEHNPEEIDHCQITELDPPFLLEYLGPTGGLRFELAPVGDQCELVFTAINHPEMGILYSVVCGWHFYTECLEWQLDGAPYDNRSRQFDTEQKIYQYYRDEKVPGFDG